MGLHDFLNSKESLSGFKEELFKDVIGLDIDIIRQDHANGVKTAEPCRIAQMSEYFAWMRGHQNCFTGYPNDGKSQFALYLMTVKSLKDRWKWVVWSPEMKSANFVDNKVKVHYNILAYDIMAMCTKKTPYRHINEKYHIPLMEMDEIVHWVKWIEEHFIFLNPNKTDINSMYQLLKNIYDKFGFDGILIDPFKNIEPERNVRDDQHLHSVFARFKEFAIETNTVMNWIAHPKSNVNRLQNVKGETVSIPCNQYMLAGGAAWDNSMDGIYSIFRPNTFVDITDTAVQFHNMKQKMQELVASRGVVSNINFDVKTRRYLFEDLDPIENNSNYFPPQELTF